MKTRRPAAALLSSLSAVAARVPPVIRRVGVAGVVGAAVLTTLSSLNLFSERVTRLPAPPPEPSPWTVAHATAANDGACQLAIRVRDEGGDPIANAPLHIVRIVDGGDVVERSTALTDARGGHRLIDLPAGYYDVTVDVAGKALAGAPTFSCNADGRRAFFDVDVKDAHQLVEGTIRGRQKKPLSSATLALWQDDLSRTGIAGVVRVRADDEGRFSARLPAGRYLGFVTADQHVSLRTSLNVTGPLTADLRLAFSPAVRGIVVDETGRPLVGAVVAVGGAFDPKATTNRVVTDATGHFTLPIHEGQQLSLTAHGEGRVARAVLGVVDNVGGLQNIRLVAGIGRTVEGVVLRADGGFLAFGAVHYRVRALGLEGEAPTDGNGRFVLDGMPADNDVEVWAAGNASGAWGAQVATPSTSQLALTFVAPAW